MQFPISIACPSCQAKLKLKEKSHLGRSIRCPKCGEKFKAEAPDSADVEEVDIEESDDAVETLPPIRTKSKAAKAESIRAKPAKKSKKSGTSKRSNNSELLIALCGCAFVLVGIGGGIWFLMSGKGSNAGNAGGNPNGGVQNAPGTQAAPADEFALAAADAPKEERRYLFASKPFLQAVVAHDYPAVYRSLSKHALVSMQPEQFVTTLEDHHVPLPLMKDVTEEQFAEWMPKMESARGIPVRVRHLYVQSADPKILAGQGDGIETMFTLGGMPKEIPAAIRKASIRAQLEIKYTDEQVKEIAKQYNIPEEKVRKGKIHGDEDDEDWEEKPYMNVKFVLVEEDGELKVGYFEFIPPSMLD